MKVLVEKQGAVTTWVLNRPEARNAIDPETAELLHRAVADFERDDSARAAVLCGAGETFCAGWDLKLAAQGLVPPDLRGEGALRVCRRIPSKPVIAAVSGHAVAGGLELALWCDLRVADETAVFGVFCRRFGVPLIDGGTVRLPRLIGQGRALDMILTGRPVDAREALSFGLANRVVPAGAARAAAEQLAHELARFPQRCMRADRASALGQWGLDFAEAIRREAENGSEEVLAEARAGAARFVSGTGRGGSFD